MEALSRLLESKTDAVDIWPKGYVRLRFCAQLISLAAPADLCALLRAETTHILRTTGSGRGRPRSAQEKGPGRHSERCRPQGLYCTPPRIKSRPQCPCARSYLRQGRSSGTHRHDIVWRFCPWRPDSTASGRKPRRPRGGRDAARCKSRPCSAGLGGRCTARAREESTGSRASAGCCDETMGRARPAPDCEPTKAKNSS